MCVNICLCVSLCLSMLGCVCFYVPFFLSVCVPLAVYVCVWSVSGYVCVCVCVPWKSQQGTEHVQSEDKGVATRPQKSAEIGGSGGAGDNESVRAQESDDIFARTSVSPQDLDCAWGWRVKSVLSRDLSRQGDPCKLAPGL